MGFRAWGLEFRVLGVCGSGAGIWGSGVWGLGWSLWCGGSLGCGVPWRLIVQVSAVAREDFKLDRRRHGRNRQQVLDMKVFTRIRR